MPACRYLLIGVMVVASATGCKGFSTVSAIAGGLTALQGLFITDQQELAIGQKTRLQVLGATPEYPNPLVRDYVTRIGRKMVAQSERKDLPFEFHVLDTMEVNAFAAPGGFVFVTTGALRLMKNEAQLAGVIGHEVGHVARRHSIRGIQETLVAQGFEMAVLGKDSDKLSQTGANIAANLILKGFDRGKETEADTLGARYSYAAGYDCRELGGFLEVLGKTVGDTPTWLIPVADHPRSDDRIQALAKYIADQHYDTTGKLTDDADFKANVLDQLPQAAPVTVASPAAKPTAVPVPAN